MKLFLWILLGFAIGGFAFWAIIIQGTENPVLVSLVVAVFTTKGPLLSGQ